MISLILFLMTFAMIMFLIGTFLEGGRVILTWLNNTTRLSSTTCITILTTLCLILPVIGVISIIRGIIEEVRYQIQKNNKEEV